MVLEERRPPPRPMLHSNAPSMVPFPGLGLDMFMNKEYVLHFNFKEHVNNV